jgi:hypothetical protein
LDDWQPEDVNGHVDDVNGHVDDVNGHVDDVNGHVDDVNGHVDDGTKTLDSTVSALVNRWLLSKLDDTSDEMQSKVSAMEHTVTKGRSEGKDNITITNASGVCYAAAATGNFHTHKDSEKAKLVLSKTSGVAMCAGNHDDVKLRGKDSPNGELKQIKEICGLYGAKKAFREVIPSETGAGEEYEISTTQQMTKDAFNIVYGHAETNSYQKEGGTIMRVNEQCKYDFEQLKDYRGDEMTFEAYYNHVKSTSPALQTIHAAIPHVRNTIVGDMNTDDLGRLPFVHRKDELFGFLNGVLCIQTGESDEPYTLDQEGNVEHGPHLIFKTNGQLDDNGVIGTVRKFFPIEFDPGWMNVDTTFTRDAAIALEQSDCNRFLQTLRDQGFFADFQDFTVGTRTQQWPVAKLLLAFMGRALFKTGTWDDYAFMMWLYGASRYGKTLVNFILSQFYQGTTIAQVTSQSRQNFGKESLVGKSLIWFTDPKKATNGTGFPMEVSEVQTLIEGGRTNVSRLHKKDLNNIAIDGASVADSNKKPGQIWSDEDAALLNRMATFPYTKEPPVRMSSYKAEDGKKNPIIRHEMGALLCLVVRCYQDLLTHAKDSTFIDWKIPMFMDARDRAARQSDPLLRFLTLPKGEVKTKAVTLWCEYVDGAETPVRELKKRFLAWMEFDQKKRVEWDDIDLNQSLYKASKEFEGDITIKEQSHWYKCNKCDKDVDCNRNKPQVLNDCCPWYRDTRGTKGLKAKRTPCNQVKKKEVAKILGLKLCEETNMGVLTDMSDWKWNGKCGCGKKAKERTAQTGVRFYSCYFGAVDDAKCNMRYQTADELDTERVAVGGSNFP